MCEDTEARKNLERSIRNAGIGPLTLRSHNLADEPVLPADFAAAALWVCSGGAASYVEPLADASRIPLVIDDARLSPAGIELIQETLQSH